MSSDNQGPAAASSAGKERDSHQPVTDSDSVTAIPQAVVRSAEEVTSKRLQTRLWWLTGICIALALGLVFTEFRSRGTTIRIRFNDGHGLKAGDTLRYLGIDVGAVKSVQITDDLAGVEVGVLLATGNEKIAVAGSQFWIERARLRLGQVTGLDTVLGAKYLEVIPGSADGPRVYDFEGLETPLNITRGDSSEIQVHFPAGEGLEVGDTARYRGMAVGEVTYVELSEDIDSVLVGVRLVGASRSLAREGTQFWIERPRLDLTEIRGLETLVGGRYIAIQPTTDSAPPQSEFLGLAEPPPLPRRDGSLEVELDAPRRLGLVRGAPITYRGLEVGRVSNVGLSSDGATVKVNVVVDAEYADLIRDNSKWWAIGGLKVDASLGGVHIAVDSLSAWIRGGVAFATPENPGDRVVTGHRFVLEDEPVEEWLDWQPRIAVGHSQMYGRELPRPIRVVASWQSSLLGLYKRRTVECWGVALDDGYMCVPLSFVQGAEAEEDVRIEVAGKSFVFLNELVVRDQVTARVWLPKGTKVATWPTLKLASWRSNMTLMVVNPELSEPLALDSTRVAIIKDVGLQIAPGVPLSPTLDGSPVVDATTGSLVGLLVHRDEGWVVGRISGPK